jgi:hypothetical protein
MHPIHSIGPKTHVFGRFGLFRCCTKVDAKLSELVLLTHKFAKRRYVRKFRNEGTRSTPVDPKLMFWGVSDRFVTARKSMQSSTLAPLTNKFANRSYIGKFRNKRTCSTKLDPKRILLLHKC